MDFEKYKLPEATLLHLYKALLTPRLIEEKMLILLRQNQISKWFSGIGQEAISVGVVEALEKDEYILPLHRNLGIFTGRGLPLDKLFKQWQGKKNGFTKGRDRSFHFGTNEHHIVGMISHLGPQLAVADGIALAHKLKSEAKVTVTFSGDGGSSEGDFHEALNVAAVWDLPVIFVIENNGYGLSTPSVEQFRFKSFTDKGPGYGIEAKSIDGNNVLEVYATVQEIAQSLRKQPRPFLLECNTFRMRGHEEASGTKYVPKALMEAWAAKDPVKNYEQYLLNKGVLDAQKVADIKADIKKTINKAWQATVEEPEITPDTAEELADMYKPAHVPYIEPDEAESSELRMIDAISQALHDNMQRYPELVLMGQDIAEYGGVFKITEGFVQKFGKDRVRNTPLCESAIIGAALGLSIKGMKAMVEMQFADFVTCGFNQIVNNLAKSHYRWGQHADVVVRMPTGAGVAAGPFHSQSNEAWFFHTPGLKIVYPSNPYDAKGLLNTAFADPNPYLYFEHKALYRSVSGKVPNGYYTLPEGKANIIQKGHDATVITYGAGVHWMSKYLAANSDKSIELIDLRWLLPWDKETVAESVKKTGKVLVLHEDTLTGGIGAEIAAWIGEHCFKWLDAPVMREGSLDTAVPFSAQLEQNFLPTSRLEQRIHELLAF
jgi:2-oxoisovalerate dehydrogenase E1 component